MEHGVPRSALVQVVEPYYPKANIGRTPLQFKTAVRSDYMRLQFALSDPAMEEPLRGTPVLRDFAKLCVQLQL